MSSTLIATKDQTPASTVSFLDMKARRIKDLSEKFAENAVALGIEFRQARERFPAKGGALHKNASRPGWEDWVKANTGWSRTHAVNFIRIADKFEGRAVSGMSFRVLELLARDTVPDEAVNDVLSRGRMGREAAKEIIAKHLPTPSQAIKEAQERGRLIAARDGNTYSGADENEIAAYSERRREVYAIRDAIERIASCPFTAKQWVEAAEDHWLAPLSLGQVEQAFKWLDKLQEPLAKRKKVIQ